MMTLPRYKWTVLAMLWLVCLLNYADRQAISSIFPLLEREFGFSKAQLGLIGSAFMWVYAASAPFAGFAGDCHSRKGLILGGCFFWSLMTAVTGWSAKLWQFITARALIGLGESVYFPAATSLLSDYHGPGTRSTALSLHQSAVYIGTIAGGWLGAVIADRFGWRWAFYGFGTAGIVVSLVLWSFLREPGRGSSGAVSGKSEEKLIQASNNDVASSKAFAGFWEMFLKLVRRPGVALLMAAFGCANAVGAVFLIWTPTFLVEKFHLSLVSAGFSAVAGIQFASALSAPLSGVVADRLAIRIKGARMLVQAVALLHGSVCVVLVGGVTTMGWLLVAMIGFGLCKGAYDGGIFAAVFDLVDPGERASVAGLMNMIGWGGGAIGPLVIGLVATYGSGSPVNRMSGAIGWSGLAYLMAAGLIIRAQRIYLARAH